MGFKINVKLGASLSLQMHMVMIEVQSRGYPGEDDIVRFEENDGRA